MISSDISFTITQAPQDVWESRINLICDCENKLKVQLFCRDPTCPNKHQRVYCEECRDELKHQHKPIQYIKKVLPQIEEKWFSLKQASET